MRVRLFFSRITTLIMRNGWFLKIGITSSLLSVIWLVWYFGLQQNLDHAQSKIILQLSELKQQKILFDEVIHEYKMLHEKLNLHNNSQRNQSEPANYCKIIVDQAG